MKAKALSGIMLVLAVGFVAFSTIANAADVSLWMGAGQPTKTLLQTNVVSINDEKFCNRSTEQELIYQPSITNVNSWVFKQLSPVQSCWQPTPYGIFGSTSQGYYLRMSSGNGPVARLDNPATHTFYAVGNSSKLIGIYNVGYQRYLYMVEDVAQALELKSGASYDKYIVKADAMKWRLNDPMTSTPLAMQRIGWSENGQWLIVEATNGFVRINTTTKELLTFESRLYPYGQGQDPTYDLSISNDGRYAVVAGGNVVERTDLIYDLSSCQPVTGQPLTKSANCGKRNIKQDSFPSLAANQAAQRFMFSSNSENITVDVPENNQWNRYIMTAAGKDYHGLDYLALGDSYTSGEGEYDGASYYVKGTDGDGQGLLGFETGISGFPYIAERCHLGTRSYPYILAGEAGLSGANYHSLACSGSKVDDVMNVNTGTYLERYNGRFDQMKLEKIDATTAANVMKDSLQYFIPGRAAQIEFVSKYKPRVATIGIGGNDIGFGDKLKDCLGVGTCSYASDLKSQTGKEIYEMYDKLVSTYRQLRQASPETRFYAVGYPNIISDDQWCAPNVRLDANERQYAREVISYLDTIIHAAANEAGFTYLDIKDSMKGDVLCDQSFDGKAVQGLVGGDDQFEVIRNPVNPSQIYIIGFGNESFHPTDVGHAMIARAISASLGADTILNHNPCAPSTALTCVQQSIVTDIPAYFQPDLVTAQDIRMVDLNAQNLSRTDYLNTYSQGATFPISDVRDSQDKPVNDLLPNTTVTADIYSTKQSLTALSVGTDGKLVGTITLPSNLAPGYHTLVLHATNNLHQPVTLYEQIIIYASLDDLDGDTIPNAQDQCQFVSPSGVDVDRDGIDDACDGVIYHNPDTTKPVVTAVIEGVNDANVWLNHDATITWQVSDDSGETIVAPTTTIASQEGEHIYRSDQVCDSAGNCATGEVALKIDKTAPSVTPIIADGQPLDAWRNHETIITWDVMDNLDATITQPTDTTASMEGVHEYTSARVCDHADNCANGTIVLKIDVTVPIVGDLSWSLNPKKTTETSQLSVPVSDTRSGIARAEYFIGDVDPGQGNGARMAIANGIAQVVHTTDFVTGVYKISVRTQDIAGNWSVPNIGYLVVYDPTSGIKVRGQKTIMIEPGYGVNLPWITQPTLARFGFSVRYDKDGAIAKQSDLQLSYKTGTNCNKPTAANCHTFDLNATSIKWLTTSSANNSLATFQAAATLKTDATIQSVTVIVEAVDGARIGETAADSFGLSIYQPFSTLFISPDMSLGPLPIQRGNIKTN